MSRNAMVLSVAAMVVLCLAGLTQGATFTSAASGNWTADTGAGGTWTPDGGPTFYPIAGDTANITGGNSITVDSANAAAFLVLGSSGAGSLTMNSGGSLSLNGAGNQIFGNTGGTTSTLAVHAGGSVNVTVGSLLFANNNSTFHYIQDGGTFSFTSTASSSYGDINIVGSSTFDISGGTMTLGPAYWSGKMGANSGAAQVVNWNIGGGAGPALLQTLQGVYGNQMWITKGLQANQTTNVNVLANGTWELFGVVNNWNGASHLNLDGGTLKPTAGNTFIGAGSFTDINVKEGGVRVDSAGFTATIDQALLHGGAAAIDGGLTKIGAGTLTLTGANTYTGDTRVAAGTLAVNNANGLQNSTLNWTSADAGSITFNANPTLGGLTGDRNLDLGTRTFSVGNNNANTTYSGALSNGALTKIGAGTLTLGGVNTFTGGLTVNAGKVVGTSTAPFGSGPVTVNTGATLSWTNASYASFPSNTLNILGGTVSMDGASSNAHNIFGTVTMQGGTLTSINGVAGPANDGGWGNINLNGATVVVSGTSQSTISATTLGAGNGASFNVGVTGAPIDLLISSQIGYANAPASTNVVKNGLGTMQLSGVNTFTGGLTVNAGKVVGTSTAPFGSGPVTVKAGATLSWINTTYAAFPSQTLNILGGTVSMDATSPNAHNIYGTVTMQGGTLTSINGVAGPANDGGWGNINFNGATVVVSGTSQSTISATTLGAGNGASFNVGVTGAPIDLLVSSQIGYVNAPASTNVVKNGLGTMQLSGVNTFTGGLTVNAGKVVGTSTAPFGSGPVTVNTGGTLSWINATYATFPSQTLNILGGTVSMDAASTNAHNFYGTVTMQGGTLTSINGVAGPANDGGWGNINFNGATVVVSGTSQSTISATTIGAVNGASFNVGVTGAPIDLLISSQIGYTNGPSAINVVKNGPGTMALTANNTYTGSTLVNRGVLAIIGGKLSVNNPIYVASTAGSPSELKLINGASVTLNPNGPYNFRLGWGGDSTSTNTLTIADTSTLTLNQDGAIILGDAGTGVVNQTGGTVTLNGSNWAGVYVGNTNAGTYNLSGGNLTIKAGSLGGVSVTRADSAFNFTGGTLTLDKIVGGGAFNFGGGTLRANNSFSSAAPMTLTGTNGNATIDSNSFNITLTGALGGSGGLVKNGPGSLILAANNTYGGGTTVNAGTLQLGNNTASGMVAGNVVLNSGTLAFNRTDLFNFDGQITGTGAVTKMGSGIVNLTNTATNFTGTFTKQASANWVRMNGSNVLSDNADYFLNAQGPWYEGINAMAGYSDTIGALNGNGMMANFGTLTIGATNHDGTYSGGATATGEDKGIRDGNVVKIGTGTQTFTGYNTYTGATYVTQGTLAISGGKLSVNNPIYVSSTGGSPSELKLINGASVTLNPNGPYNFRLGWGGDSSSANTLTISDTSTLTLNQDGAIILGDNGTGVVNQTGGTVTLNGSNWAGVYVGNTNKGTYNLSGGNLTIKAGSLGGVTMNTAASAFNLTGGTLTTDKIAGVGAFNFGGGTLKANNSFSTAQAMTLTGINGNATIDTNAFNVTLNTALSGAGGLVKAGAGTLNLMAPATYGGATIIQGGTLKLYNNPAPAVPVAGAQLWLDASDFTSATAHLTTWTDKSGLGHNATLSLGDGPAVVLNAINGKPAVEFSSDSMDPGTMTARTVFAVLNNTNSTTTFPNWNTAIGGATTTNYIIQGRMGDSTLDLQWSSPLGTTYINGGPAYGNPGGPYPSFAPMGQVKVVSRALSSDATFALRIGYDRNIGGRNWDGDMGEILVYNFALTDAQRQSVEAYLMNKWLVSTAWPYGTSTLPATTALSIAGGATFDLNGANQTVASLSNVGAGGGTVTNSATGQPATLTINPASGSTTFGGAIADGASTVALTKSGAGTEVLTGANPYSGPTKVTGGKLLVDGSIGTPANPTAVSVTGGMLGGNGTINGAVNVAAAGTISAGDSPGHLVINGAYNLAGTMLAELGGTTQGVTYDWIEVNGTATLASGSIVDVNAWNNWPSPGEGVPYYVLTATGGITPSSLAGVTFDFSGAPVGPGEWKASIVPYPAGGSGAEALMLEAVPEPATMALLGLALAGLGGYIRRRRNKTTV